MLDRLDELDELDEQQYEKMQHVLLWFACIVTIAILGGTIICVWWIVGNWGLLLLVALWIPGYVFWRYYQYQKGREGGRMQQESLSFAYALTQGPIVEKLDEWWIHQVEVPTKPDTDGVLYVAIYRMFPRDTVRDYVYNADGSVCTWRFLDMEKCKEYLQETGGGEYDPIGIDDGWFIPEQPEGKERTIRV